jgi:hypothetical protein
LPVKNSPSIATDPSNAIALTPDPFCEKITLTDDPVYAPRS